MIFNRVRLFHEMVEIGIQGTLPNARQPWQLPEQDIGKGLFAFGIMPNHHRKRRQERWKTSSMRRSAFSGSKTGRLAWHILMNERQTIAGELDANRCKAKRGQREPSKPLSARTYASKVTVDLCNAQCDHVEQIRTAEACTIPKKQNGIILVNLRVI